jgi:protein-serine/threonine kinase
LTTLPDIDMLTNGNSKRSKRPQTAPALKSTLDDDSPPSQPESPQHSRRSSRAPSFSAGVLGALTKKPDSPVPPSRKRPPSVSSDKSEGSKFNLKDLKDLLGNTPKLNRKTSQRSTDSRLSSSDVPDVRKPRSTAGDSAVSLTQKYGVCQRIAIGKGATSVVRLAHKWDRTEEKLYAVKVPSFF